MLNSCQFSAVPITLVYQCRKIFRASQQSLYIYKNADFIPIMQLHRIVHHYYNCWYPHASTSDWTEEVDSPWILTNPLGGWFTRKKNTIVKFTVQLNQAFLSLNWSRWGNIHCKAVRDSKVDSDHQPQVVMPVTSSAGRTWLSAAQASHFCTCWKDVDMREGAELLHKDNKDIAT